MLKQGHIYGEVGTLERQLDPVWDLRPCPQEADGPAGEMTPVLPLPALGMEVCVWGRLSGSQDGERSRRAGGVREIWNWGGLEGWAEQEGGGQRVFRAWLCSGDSAEPISAEGAGPGGKVIRRLTKQDWFLPIRGSR